MPATGNKGQLTNWCGAKSGTTGIVYVNGPCTGTAGQWLGVTCAVVGGASRVTRLDTCQHNGSGCTLTGLGGSLPTSIGELDALTDLNLVSSGISGSIPSSVGALTRLTHLRLNNNALSGSMPPSLGALTGLIGLELKNNALSGSIPSSLGGLTTLVGLDLQYNRLTGPLPASFCSLRSAIVLIVGGNPGLTCYPSCLSSLSSMMFMMTKDASLSVCAAGALECPYQKTHCYHSSQ